MPQSNGSAICRQVQKNRLGRWSSRTGGNTVLRRLCWPGILLILLALTEPALAGELQTPDAQDRCPVCGMFVAPYQDWLATLVQQDGEQLYFDGCKDMFRYYFNRPTDERSELRDTLYVTDYYTTRLVPVDQVYFVLGSDVLGAMGKELVPVVGRDHAETFKKDHAGTQLLKFDQVTPDLLPAN